MNGLFEVLPTGPFMKPTLPDSTLNLCKQQGSPPWGGGGWQFVYPPVWLLFLYGALDSHGFFPSHFASGCCFLSAAAAAGAPAGVVSAFMEPSGWCAGAVLDVAVCAVCVSAAPSSWRTGVVLLVVGVV